MVILPWDNRKCWKQSWQLYLYCFFVALHYLYPCMVKNTCSWGLSQPTNQHLAFTHWVTVGLAILPYQTADPRVHVRSIGVLRNIYNGPVDTVDSTKHTLRETGSCALIKWIPPEMHINTDELLKNRTKMKKYSFVHKSKNIFPEQITLKYIKNSPPAFLNYFIILNIII